MREKILRAIGSIPPENLYNYIKQGVVTYKELMEHGLEQYPDKQKYLASQMSAGEQSAWKDAQSANTVDAYDMFVSMFPNSEHTGEVRDALIALEDNYWMQIQQNMSEQSLNSYKRIYPEGKYLAQCDALVSDLPWFETKKRNTIEAYRTYEANNPGKHSEDIHQAIVAIEDTNDWAHCVQINTTSAYKSYLQKHPKGQYAAVAHDRITNRSQNEVVIDAIRKDDNTFSTFDLQQKVENGVITWEDLREVFSDVQIQAIRDWCDAPVLPYCKPPKNLLKDSTEVYFWGTKATGKTCAMGAVLSAAKREGRLIPLNCQHGAYLAQLSNLFASSRGTAICNLPPSTQKDSISELNMELVDDKNKKHKVTFIDLAGEMVTGIYKLQNGIALLESEQETVKQILSYLSNPYNNKIHFFVLEYGAAHREVKELSGMGYMGVHQDNVLTSIAQFLDQNGCLRKSTVGVYGLVTKSDTIDIINNSTPEDRPRLANEYVKNELASFWNAVTIACKRANVRDVKTISFSIGDVFAQNLCVFDGSDSKKIINRLLLKTQAERRGCLGWLFK